MVQGLGVEGLGFVITIQSLSSLLLLLYLTQLLQQE